MMKRLVLLGVPVLLAALSSLAYSAGEAAPVAGAATQPGGINVPYGRQLMERSRNGEKLTPAEVAYLDRVWQEMIRRRLGGGQPTTRPVVSRVTTTRPTTQAIGLILLNQMTAQERYKGEDGGLYGSGSNVAPKEHQAAAEAAVKTIAPLDADGKAAKDGKIVLMSIGISNTTMEFSLFKQLADNDADKNPDLVIVDSAQGGRDALRWSNKADPTWDEAERRLKAAGVTSHQVQVVWIKMVIAGPERVGGFPDYARKLQEYLVKIINLAKERYPNLKLAFLSSRIYAGYATVNGNPEPWAYEGAFAVRWLIQDQIKGNKDLNFDAARGDVKAPVLLWGPYLWADGVNGRKCDSLVWKREDFADDGMHPSLLGRQKVAGLLLDFFKTDANAKGWFTRGISH